MTANISTCYSPLNILLELIGHTQEPSLCSSLLHTPMSELTPITLIEYLKTLGLTLFLEFFFFLIPFIFHGYTLREILKKGFQSAFLCNILSHPIIYFIFPALAVTCEMTYIDMLIRAEIFAPLLEAIVFFRIWKLNQPLSLASIVAANLTSWGVGIYLI